MSFLAFVALGLMGIVRFGVLTHQGRAFVMRHLDGLDLGSLGKLHVAGLRGDLWSSFSLRELSVVDAKGAWIEAKNLRVAWTPLELLDNHLHIQVLAADRVTLAHRPVLGGSGPSRPGRYDVRIERMQGVLETLPAVSVERGLFQVAGALEVEPGGGVAGAVEAENLDHRGDGLSATFDLRARRKMQLDARAHESQGGAIAGALGLTTGKPFDLNASAEGDVDAGEIKLSALIDRRPIAGADGAWTRKGGVARGWISLAASRWTAGYADAFGPKLDFVAQQAQLTGSVKQFDVRFFADNASLSANGALDAVKLRSDQGFKLQAQIADLSKLVSAPKIGPARFAGVVTGGLGDFDLSGQAELERVFVAGYSLARASGPMRLVRRNGEFRLTANADGIGGSGGGALGALAGARPHVSLDGAQLADGRWLLRDLRAKGAGLSVSATGSRGLFGDLSFKGQAQLASLSVLGPPMKGAVDVKWSASQANGRQPWKFSLNGGASGFASGQELADHLVGEKPRVALEAAYADGAVSVSQLDLTGAAARASGSGALARDHAVKLVLDWSAAGPFGMGPVVVDGKARGSAVIGGSLERPQASLGADFERIDLPQLSLAGARTMLAVARSGDGFAGRFSLTATDSSGPAHARFDFQASDGAVSLGQLDAAAGGASAHGSATFRKGAVDAADLTFAAGPGALLAHGHAEGRLQLSQQAGAGHVELSLSGAELVLKGQGAQIRTLAVKANGPLQQLPYTVAAEVEADQAPFRINGGGTASRSAQGLALSFNGSGQFRRASFKTLSPAQIVLNGVDHTARLDLALGGGRAEIQADQNGPGLSAKAALTGVDLGALGEDLAGRFDADLSLNGQGERLDGRLTARLKGARSRDAPAKLAMNGQIDAALSGPQLTVDAAVEGSGPGDRAQAHLLLPASAAAAPFRFAVDQAGPVSGQFSINGELQPVWDLFFGDGRELGGQLALTGQVAGSVNAPQVTGQARLANGRFEDAGTGLKLREISAEAMLNGQTLDVRRFAANDVRSGVLSGQGRLDLAPNGASTLTLTARSFQLLDNESAKATASGTVTVVQDAKGHARLSGGLTIDRADISAETSRVPPGVVAMDVVERNRPYSMDRSLEAPVRAGPSIDLDVSIGAPRRIYVKGLGLDAELSLDAHVTGTTSDPQLEGSAHIVRGDYDLAGNRFTIDDRGVVYLANSPDKIRLDLTATRDNPTLTAIIRIQGTAAKPLITLSSTPTLPDDEVLSQVLFGQSAAQLSPVQAAQVAAAVTTLATGGGFDVMGGLKNFSRLDRLALGGGEAATGVTVSGGKYIGSRVYLEVTGGGRQGPSAQVEVKATKSLSVISQIGGEVGAKLQVRWRRDYGRPKSAAKPAGPKGGS